MAIMETLFQSIATLDLRNSAIPEHLTYKNIVLEIYREARINSQWKRPSNVTT